jgi:hypothetical protein
LDALAEPQPDWRRGAEALLTSANLPRLSVLDLNDNDIATLSPAALAASKSATRLRTLYCDSNGLDNTGAAALAGCPVLDGVRDLRLSYNQIGDASEGPGTVGVPGAAGDAVAVPQPGREHRCESPGRPGSPGASAN